jgi:DNA-binding transcriptional LysR family regulator
MLPDIRQLQHVTTIGRYRSFGRAAHALGMSQPALSKSIRVLETALGVRLFERGRTGATPTAFGQLVLSRAGALIHNLDELVAEIGRAKGLTSGTLTVGAAFYPYDLLVAPAIGRLARLHPTLHLRVARTDWRVVAQEVLGGVLDVGVAEMTIAERERGLEVERLTPRSGTFFVRRGHPLSGEARLSFEQLAPYPFTLTAISPRVVSFFQEAGIRGRVDPATGNFLPAITVDSVALMKSIVRDTLSFGWAPEVLISTELEAGELVALPVEAPWAKTDYGIIRLRDRPITPAQDAFLTELRAIDGEVSASETQRGGTPARSRRRSRRSAIRRAPTPKR